MNATQLKRLLERVQAWPETAQEELVAVANEIESELQASDYVATRDELQAIDGAIAAIDRGEDRGDPFDRSGVREGTDVDDSKAHRRTQV